VMPASATKRLGICKRRQVSVALELVRDPSGRSHRVCRVGHRVRDGAVLSGRHRAPSGQSSRPVTGGAPSATMAACARLRVAAGYRRDSPGCPRNF
jgi:hypothetical protein